jgi:hypothetical protein
MLATRGAAISAASACEEGGGGGPHAPERREGPAEREIGERGGKKEENRKEIKKIT